MEIRGQSTFTVALRAGQDTQAGVRSPNGVALKTVHEKVL
jgi:hypothetical protein